MGPISDPTVFEFVHYIALAYAVTSGLLSFVIQVKLEKQDIKSQNGRIYFAIVASVLSALVIGFVYLCIVSILSSVFARDLYAPIITENGACYVEFVPGIEEQAISIVHIERDDETGQIVHRGEAYRNDLTVRARWETFASSFIPESGSMVYWADAEIFEDPTGSRRTKLDNIGFITFDGYRNNRMHLMHGRFVDVGVDSYVYEFEGYYAEKCPTTKDELAAYIQLGIGGMRANQSSGR